MNVDEVEKSVCEGTPRIADVAADGLHGHLADGLALALLSSFSLQLVKSEGKKGKKMY